MDADRIMARLFLAGGGLGEGGDRWGAAGEEAREGGGRRWLIWGGLRFAQVRFPGN